MSNVLKNFTKYYRGQGTLVTNECFIYDGTLLVAEEALGTVLGISDRQVVNLRKQGMHKHSLAVKGAIVYDIIFAIKWYENFKSTTLPSQYVAPVETTDINKQNADELDLQIKRTKLKTDKLKHSELAKELIKAEDLDKAMSEQAVLHKTYYQDDLDILPVSLVGMDREAMTNFLAEHYEARIENVNHFINKTYKGIGEFHKKIMEFINE